MAPPFYLKPENTLKRAEELIGVGQASAALQQLHDMLVSKRTRSMQITTLEPMVLRFVELCVEQRKGKMVKEGLHQYKNVAQNSNVASIELVIKKFVELSEAKVSEAQARAEKITLDQIEDLEATETPESILLSTVSGEQTRDRTDRAVVTPWLKFLWEAYRTVLDILRNNDRLEILYQATANQAFQFCLRYSRKTEFRRLCELLRNHLQNIAKYSHQPHAINLNDPDSLQRHLETRFNQLNAAVDLELWQEAFRSVEDIHNLLSMSKRPPKPVMMANYYEKLAKIFMVGDNYLFHAAAWNRYFTLVKAQNKGLTEEEQTRLASLVLISALAIPIISTKQRASYLEFDENQNRSLRLASLLGMVRAPTRSGLLKEALGKNILRKVRPEIRDLYNILEVQFHPLSICKKIEPIMAQIAADPSLERYVKPLHQVILTRLLQQLSQVYSTVKLEFVMNLARFPSHPHDAADIEKFIMNGCKKGELSIRINHATKSLTFETDLFAPPRDTVTDGPKLQTEPAELMRTQLSRLSKCLHSSLHLIDPSVVEAKREEKRSAFQRALAGVEEEHRASLARKAIIERKKELMETLLIRKEKEEAREKALRMQQEAEAERQRLAEESKRRELERLRREREEIQRAEARKLAEQLKAKSGVELNLDQLENLDTENLVRIQVEQLAKEKSEIEQRLSATARRMDHMERALRMEEIPLLAKDYERQRKMDRAYHTAAQKAALDAARAKHTEDIKIKKRMLRILPDYQEYRKQCEAKRHDEFEARRNAMQKKIEEEKQKRIELFRARKEEERKRRELEEKARAQQEEEEKRRAEEEARLEQERMEQEEAKRKEYEERRRKLDEIARKQAERERAAEEKIRESKERLLREQEESRRESEAAKSAGTRYVPPSKRATAPASEGGAWRPGGATGRPSWRDREAAREREAQEREEPSWRRPAPAPAPAPEEAAPKREAPLLFKSRAAEEGGGWRARLARKQQEQQPSDSQANGGEEAAGDDGFTTVRRSRGKK
ncbi:uncharacterized protein VTP21DRAFT_2820 [Calcarisporiella thermophila]|uniref:uncharacterized protein n=1 Tax=Calcarisporiella thermophila TaxID=911321 RepID=UPI003742AA43